MFEENIEQLNFTGNPEGCRTQINALVEQVTQNNIKDLLVPSSISSETKLVVVNAAFFKGLWSSKFEKEDTTMDIFYDHGKMPVYVEMMKQRGQFNYGTHQCIFFLPVTSLTLVSSTGVIEQLKTVFLEMPYKGEDGSISMFIFLPIFTPTAIDELLAEITPEILDEAFSGGLQREVDVEFPKISFERTFELVPVRMAWRNLLFPPFVGKNTQMTKLNENVKSVSFRY